MRIIITESQLHKVVDEVKLITKNELLRKGSEDTIEIDVVGTYGIGDMNEFYNLSPFKTTREIGFGHSEPNDLRTNWRYLTGHYPVVVLKIPFYIGKEKKYMSSHYKNVQPGEKYSFSDNELFVVFANDGTNWMSRRIWTAKQRPDAIQIFKKHLTNKSVNEFANNLTKLGNLKEFNPMDILSKLSSILSGVPKTKKEDIYITDDDINREFREPIRFTVRNGEDPKPIIDKIMKKYGRLTKSILDILNSTTIQTLKHKRTNPYL